MLCGLPGLITRGQGNSERQRNHRMIKYRFSFEWYICSKMVEMLMKKEVGFFLAMMCVLTLVGCGTLDNAEK